MSEFREHTFSMNQGGEFYLNGNDSDYLEEKVLDLTVSNADEEITLTLDWYHLRELRLALQRAERWMSKERR